MGEKATFEGNGELQEQQFSHYKLTTQVSPYEIAVSGTCTYLLDLYPNQQLRNAYETSIPALFTGLIVAIFFFMAFSFIMYDRFVQAHNNKIMNAAVRTDNIVSSLFPGKIRDRLLGDDANAQDKNQNLFALKAGIKNFLGEGDGDGHKVIHESKPIADLFPETTILFTGKSGNQLVWVNQEAKSHLWFSVRHCRLHRLEFGKRAVTGLSASRDCLPR